MEKQKLTEQFFIKGKIDNVSAVDTRLIKNHILSNFMLVNRYSALSPTYSVDTRLVKRPL